MKYYREATSPEGRKYRIIYSTSARYWKCDTCGKAYNWGDHIVNARTTSEKQINLDVLVKRIIEQTITFHSNDTTALCIQREAKSSDGKKERCKGTIKYVGYKILIEDRTQAEVKDMGAFAMQFGVKTTHVEYILKRNDVRQRVWDINEQIEAGVFVFNGNWN